MSRLYQAGDTFVKSFTISSATGAAANADSTPTAVVYRNGAADVTLTVTITNPATGVYKAACTIPGGYAVDDVVELLVSATVGGVATKAIVDVVRLVAFDPSDVGDLGLTNLDAAITSRASQASVDAVQADTDNLQTRVPAALVGGRMDASVGAVATDAITAGGMAASAGAEIASAVRTELAVELARIDAAITTRLALAGYTAPDNATIAAIAAYVDTEVAAIKAKTDNLPASPAAVGSIMQLDTTQVITDVGGIANTLGGVLSLMRSLADGKFTNVSGLLRLFGQNGTTQVGVDRTITGDVPANFTRQ